MGASADSYYEYLLKAWILLGRSNSASMYRDMWIRAMDEMLAKLVGRHVMSGYTFVGDSNQYAQNHLLPLLLTATCAA